MATLEQHCKECFLELGDSFRHVHEWLDEFQAKYGPMHRSFRHHAEGVEQVRARWGDKAAQAALMHIRNDTGGIVPTRQELRDYWGIKVEEMLLDEYE